MRQSFCVRPSLLLLSRYDTANDYITQETMFFEFEYFSFSFGFVEMFQFSFNSESSVKLSFQQNSWVEFSFSCLSW